MEKSGSGRVSDDEARAALERLLASRDFAPGTRAARFLRFVVEEALAGRGDRVKELTLGIAVFDREPARFDPRTDPIVRVEARRVRDKLAAYYRDQGRAEPVAISLPKGSYTPVWARTSVGGAAAAPGASVAVLPFLNLTGNARFEPFTDALTDEITDALVKLPGLKVVARTSAFRFKGRHEDIRSIGAALGVDTILEGSVQIAGERMKVIAQLNRASNGFHIWSSIYETKLADPFDVQADIARHVTRTLLPNLRDARVPDPEARRPRDADAWEAYARATYHLRKMSPNDYREAYALAQRAVAIDPTFARGHALLGAARFRAAQGWGANGVTDTAIVEHARADLRRAIELAPDLGSAHCALGRIALMIDYDWPEARECFERALALAPGVADVHAAYGHALGLRRLFAEARRHLLAAMELDPLSLFCRLLLASLSAQERDYASAVAGFEEALVLEPGNLWAAWPLCVTLVHAGDLERAARESAQLAAREPGYPHPRLLLAAIAARAGDAADAVVRIDREAAVPGGQRWPYALAAVYALVGHRARAFEWLDQARLLHDSNFAWIHVDPAFDELRADARFEALMTRVPGLALTAERSVPRAGPVESAHT